MGVCDRAKLNAGEFFSQRHGEWAGRTVTEVDDGAARRLQRPDRSDHRGGAAGERLNDRAVGGALTPLAHGDGALVYREPTIYRELNQAAAGDAIENIAVERRGLQVSVGLHQEQVHAAELVDLVDGCSVSEEYLRAAVLLRDTGRQQRGRVVSTALRCPRTTTTRAGVLATFEQSRIDTRASLAQYVASPEGQRPVVFTEKRDPLALVAPNTVTFENGDHDYPQRITYRATDKGLAANISLLDGSRPAAYAWERCDG